MHEANYRLLRHTLEQLPPKHFDYGIDNGGRTACGCVFHHILRSGLCTRDTVAIYLGITEHEADNVYWGYCNSDGMDAFGARALGGKAGIRRAVQCLDEIAAAYGLSPEPISATQVRERGGAEESARNSERGRLAGVQPLVTAETCGTRESGQGPRQVPARQLTGDGCVGSIPASSSIQPADDPARVHDSFTDAERAFLATLRAECEVAAK